jgi:DGQHR domain-containing protein
MTLVSTGLSLPALRGRQGGRVLYLALSSNGFLNSLLPTEPAELSQRSQRRLDPRHAEDIARYIQQNPTSYALGAVTYALEHDGDFDEIAPESGMGVLRLPMEIRMRSVDGQHRREGIRRAVEILPDLLTDTTALLLYVEPEVDARKQMFSDMNNTARKVSKAVNVAFDARDPFASVVNKLAKEHDLLVGRIEHELPRIRPGGQEIYTLGALHDAVKRLFVGPSGRVRDPQKFDPVEIQARAEVFLNGLLASRPELLKASTPSTNILFSSTTLRVIAGAVWMTSYEHGDAAVPAADALRRLGVVDFSPRAELWLQSGLVSPGRTTPNARSQEVLAATDALAKILQTPETNIRKSES